MPPRQFLWVTDGQESVSDLVIGGAGIFGLTIAQQAASCGFSVKIIEQKNQIGGNMASHIDEETGIEVHTYGSHIFHTNNERVWQYVNQFTSFVPYIHRVRTTLRDGSVIPLPFGLATFSTYYKMAFTPEMMRRFVETFPDKKENFEQMAISSIGGELYKAVVEGYTRKQWGRDPKELPASTIKRLPVRYTWDDSYFTDKYQGLPIDGYQTWMTRMADHPLIEIDFNKDALNTPITTPYVHTGEIDRFFAHAYGRLNWRTVDLVEERPNVDDFQGCPVMNYADASIRYTRVHEYKHYRPDREARGTIIHKEYARDAKQDEVGAYPVNTIDDQIKLKKYREAASAMRGVWFGGRLGSYKYIDMHAAIASALTMWSNEIKPYLEAQ